LLRKMKDQFGVSNIELKSVVWIVGLYFR
jgi:hypothetical protein